MSRVDGVRIEHEAIGTGGKARLVVKATGTGDVLDVDTIDLSRAPERSAFARRLAERRGVSGDDLEQQLLQLARTRCGLDDDQDVQTWPTLADAIVEWRKHERTPVVETGFAPLDSLLGGGLPVGGLVVLTARPNLGKSALALQLVEGALELDPALEVVWGLGEMTLEALARRAISAWSTGPGRLPVSMPAADQRTKGAREVADDLERTIASRLHLVPPPLTMDRLEAAVVDTKSRLLVIDYVQLVALDHAADRRAEVDGIVKRLRAATLDLGLATLVVSNISKNVSADTRIGAIGKESSEIDFAADVLLLGDCDAEGDQDDQPRTVRWLCKKNRHGPRRDLETSFDGRLQTFIAAQPFDEFAGFAPVRTE